jgi:ankyrin repeat protein
MKYCLSVFLVLFSASLILAADSNLPGNLIKAVYENDLAAIQKAVTDNISVIHLKDSEGMTLLLMASSLGKIKIVEFLLESSSDIEARDAWDRTPLIIAARETGGIEVIKLLVEKSAVIDAIDKFGDSALDLAAWRGFEDIVDYLLDKGATVNINNEKGRQLLGQAAENRLEKLFNLMAVKGADLNIKVEDNATLLHQASAGGSLKIIDALLKSNMNVKLTDDNGWTPLHYAALNGRIEVIKLLLKNGAEINARNLMGESPLNIASAWGTQEAVNFLRMHGADDVPAKFPKLTGEYMGMPKPGNKREPFGKGVVINHFKPHSTIVFSPAGREAFWTIMLPPKEKGYGSNALMHSKMIGETWTYPVPLNLPKTGIHMDVPFFSYDGDRLYFISRAAIGSNDNSGKERIWFSERKSDSWEEPKLLDKNVNSFPIHWQFSFDLQGNIYFAQGGSMFFSLYSDGKFSKPKDMKEMLGKDKVEGDTPFIAPDGSYLIYSAFMKDKPDVDLFISFKKKDGTWTDPINMGDGINTPGHELCPIVTHDGKYLFYSSNFKFMWVKADIIEQLRFQSVKE